MKWPVDAGVQTMTDSWEDVVARKRAARTTSLPAEWLATELPSGDNVLDFASPHLSPAERAVTEASASDIVDRIAGRHWSSTFVVTAFIKRATVAQQLLNAVSEVNFAAALEAAQSLDEYQATHGGRTIGPLHGLPVSFKDSVNIAGLPTSMSYVAWAFDIAEQDAVLVAACRAAGAIPLAKTTCGHTLMMGETVSNLFGRTLNPHNLRLTPGGSSGGEAALLSYRGSPVGWGTDIGGSIRLPCASTALWGLRPSHGRVSYRGFADTFIGQEAVKSVAGPMGHSPADLALVFKAYLAFQPWLKDPAVIPLPWRSIELPRRLCFAFVDGDETVTPHPPIRRGLQHAARKLREAGHHVINYPHPVEAERAGRLMLSFWRADGGKEVSERISASGEPMIDEVAQLLNIGPESSVLDAAQCWQNQHDRDLYAQSFLDNWQSTALISTTGRPIDGLICPAAPFTARPHGAAMPESRFGMFECTYANFQPLLNLTTGAFPTGLCQDPAIDVPDPAFVPRSPLDKTVQDLYTDPLEWSGAPIGLQLVGRRLEEEKMLAMLAAVEDALFNS